MPAAVKSTSFLHLATIGYRGTDVHGILAFVKLVSKLFHASAYVICCPSFKNPLLMNEYEPAQFESPQVVLASVALQ